MFVHGLIIGIASAGATLDRAAIVEAEWSRDMGALLGGTYETEDLPWLARALGRSRDAAVCDRLALLAADSDLALASAAAPGLGWTAACVDAARSRLDVENRPAVRAGLWHALGVAGDTSDIPRCVGALTGPDTMWAAWALGRLAQRGVPGVKEAATAGLVGLLEQRWTDRSVMAAFALHRARSGPLPAELQRRALDAWWRLPSEEARAWLVSVLLPAWPVGDPEREALVSAGLADPSRLVRAAVLGAADPADLPGATWLALADDADGWVRAQARSRLGRTGPCAELPAELEQDLDAALARLDTLAPRDRTYAAMCVLERTPTDAARIERIARSGDEALVELALDHVSTAGPRDPRVLVWAGAVEGVSAQMTALGALSSWKEPLPLVRGWAEAGPFPLRRAAAVWLDERGGGVTETAAAVPGDPSMRRSLAEIWALRTMVVETTQGTFSVDLDPQVAPMAVAQMAWLADQRRLDDLSWHRVVPGFVVQTGCPRGDGMGGTPWMIPDEVSMEMFEAGSVGMARSARDTGGSQWFVTASRQPHLAGDYTRFGEVADGLDVVRRLGQADRVLRVRVVQPGRREQGVR